MSGPPDDQPGERGQSREPQGRPQGGQPQGGQPQGQPQSGPGGGQPAPAQAGPGIGDVFNRQDTLSEIKLGVASYAVVGVGLGLGILLTGLLSDTTDPGYFVALITFLGTFALPPLVGVVVALRQADTLTGPPENLRLATAGVTGAAGGFVMLLIVSIFAAIGLDTGSGGASLGSAPGIGDIFLPAIFISIAAGVTAAGVVWVLGNLGSNGAAGAPRR